MDSLKVNMMAEARNAQWSADIFLGPGAIKAVAPAKVNLFLGVKPGKKNDGYHEVVNVMHALALHDTLYFHHGPLSTEEAALLKEGQDLPEHMAIAGPNDNLLISITLADKTASTNSLGAETSTTPLQICAKDNLVAIAIDQLAREIGFTGEEKVSVHIEKCIPHQAGLGGGSSDAASALIAMADLWNTPADSAAMHLVAERLGSDVAFFLHGGCALCEGRGEQIVRSLEPSKTPVVLVKPAGGVSTAQAYERFDADPIPIPEDLLAAAETAQSASEVPLFNNLTHAAEQIKPELSEIAAWLSKQLEAEAPDNVLLCGSGAATFAIAPDFSTASRIATAAQARGWWARATTLSRLRATLMPS